MSVKFFVSPFDSQWLDWATKCSVPAEGISPNGRPATFEELDGIASSITEHICSSRQNGDRFQISIDSDEKITFPCEGKWRNTISPGVAIAPAYSILINGGTDASGAIKWMSFHGNSELLVVIVRKLTAICGPQVIFADCDGIPWIIADPRATPVGPEPWTAPLPDNEWPK